MNLLLLEKNDFINGKDIVRLEGRRHSHITGVLKAKPGDILSVGIVGGKMGAGEIVSITKGYTQLQVTLDKEPPRPLPLSLILAMPRPLVFNRLLTSITTMGIKEISLIQTERVEKSFWKSPVLEVGNIRERLILGLEQAKDTIMPTISIHKSFKKFVKEILPDISKESLRFIAHPGAADTPKGREGHVTLAIGPEGGFINSEVSAFIDAGFQPVSIGPRILKCETVVPFLVSKFC